MKPRWKRLAILSAVLLIAVIAVLIVIFNRYARLMPNDAETWYNRGLVKSKKGDHDGAFADYNEAIRLKPDWAEA
ncbi:MAG: tetratricopeptide repeat protein, partial [Phycisphaerae bacterium]|nr:tetratricopeptide repeat protein [Phycisphaerae bacterium]